MKWCRVFPFIEWTQAFSSSIYSYRSAFWWYDWEVPFWTDLLSYIVGGESSCYDLVASGGAERLTNETDLLLCRQTLNSSLCLVRASFKEWSLWLNWACCQSNWQHSCSKESSCSWISSFSLRVVLDLSFPFWFRCSHGWHQSVGAAKI